MNYSRAGVIIEKDGAFLLMERRKPGKLYYAVLGGRPELGETPQQTAIREVWEESGLKITINQNPVCTSYDGVKKDVPEYYFMATSCEGIAQLGGEELEKTHPDNSFALVWIPKEELSSIALFPTSLHAYLMKL